jgi:Domain of unknown function (DUF4384)
MKSLLVLGILGVSVASAQDAGGLKARELFYTPPPDAAPAKPPAAQKAAPAKQFSPKRTEAPAPQLKASPQADTSSSSPAPAASPDHTVTVAAMPLGVRYSVLKRDAANQFVEVDPDTTFRSGDRIRIQVKANTTGYLYVVAQGSSGTWQVLFPSSEVAGGSNRLEPGDTRQVPPGDRGQFVFDDQGGTEKLFLVLSRQAEPDLDKLIYSMGGANPGGAAPQTPRALLAKASVTNDVVQRLRAQVTSRDLVFEKVDGEVDGKIENASYVVNPSPSPDARLVVDVSLKHK